MCILQSRMFTKTVTLLPNSTRLGEAMLKQCDVELESTYIELNAQERGVCGWTGMAGDGGGRGEGRGGCGLREESGGERGGRGERGSWVEGNGRARGGGCGWREELNLLLVCPHPDFHYEVGLLSRLPFNDGLLHGNLQMEEPFRQVEAEGMGGGTRVHLCR